MSNATHKCPTCGTEVYVSMLGGLRVDYKTGYVHDCPKKPAHLTVVPDESDNEKPKAPAKKG